MIIINFKNYKFGKEALDLVQLIDINCNKAVVAVPFLDLAATAKMTTLPVYAQHLDYNEPGRGTGFIIPEALEQTGAAGSLLNHSEHKISLAKIKKTIDRCHPLRLKLIVCTSSLTEAKSLLKLQPHAIAFEEPSLIATGKSVTSHKANTIKKFADLFKNTNTIPLCGAGISTPEDVREALALGCKGILVSSAVAQAPHPEKFLKDVSALFQKN